MAVGWIALAGADNVRDVGGLPTADGGTVRPGGLIRADNLQALTDADVRHLVDVVGVRSIADLRTGVEVASEGPGPMTREPLVTLVHLSLFPEAGATTDAGALSDDAGGDAPVVLPWQNRDRSAHDKENGRRGAAFVYLRYLDERPDSAVAALRLVARGPGATIVHCAAGKDRTGTVVALALAEIGVPAEEIVADYARSAERIEAIFTRLASRRTYANDVDLADIGRHTPRAETMEQFLTGLQDQHGGAGAWLRANGWTDADAQALRDTLID